MANTVFPNAVVADKVGTTFTLTTGTDTFTGTASKDTFNAAVLTANDNDVLRKKRFFVLYVSL